MQEIMVNVRRLDLGLQRYFSFSRELDSVAHQVNHDLAQSIGITPHDFRHLGCNVAQKLKPLLVGPKSKSLEGCFQTVAQIEINCLQFDFPHLDFRKVENVVDYCEQGIR